MQGRGRSALDGWFMGFGVGFEAGWGFGVEWKGDLLEVGEGVLSGEMAVIGLRGFLHDKLILIIIRLYFKGEGLGKIKVMKRISVDHRSLKQKNILLIALNKSPYFHSTYPYLSIPFITSYSISYNPSISQQLF